MAGFVRHDLVGGSLHDSCERPLGLPRGACRTGLIYDRRQDSESDLFGGLRSIFRSRNEMAKLVKELRSAS